MKNLLSNAVGVLFACVVAASLGFVTACAVGALCSLHVNPAEAFVRYVFIGAMPCCLLGTLQALMCWALIPKMQRAQQRMALLFRRAAVQSHHPFTAAAAHGTVIIQDSLVWTGVACGMLLSFLNVPGYLAVSVVGNVGMGFAFLSAGAVAGGLLGWCRQAWYVEPRRSAFSSVIR